MKKLLSFLSIAILFFLSLSAIKIILAFMGKHRKRRMAKLA